MHLTSLYSKADKVSPYPTCIIDAPGNPDRIHNLEVENVAHREFLTSRTVYHIIRKELFEGYDMEVPAENRGPIISGR